MSRDPVAAGVMKRVGRYFSQTDSPTRWSAIALLGVVVVLIGLIVLGLGFVHSLLLIVVILCIGTVPGTALVRILFPNASLLYYFVFGTVVGLGLWAVGGLLSSITGIFLARWIPLMLASALWFWPRLQRRAVVSEPKTRASLPFWGAAGASLGSIALLPSLKTAFTSPPVEWTGWHQFYVDLPFQIALTSEVAARSPEVFPYIPDATLSYTWLFHSAMGMWSSVSTVPAAEIVLRAWPVLFVALLPILLSIVAWEVTRDRFVSAISPLIYVLVHGPVVVEGSLLEQQPLLQISPTRDFAHLFTLVALLSMVRLFQRTSTSVPRSLWLVPLLLSSFVAVGAKGSELPILLGGILSAGLVLILTRRVKRSDFVALGWFVAAVASSTLLVLPEPGVASISWGPLTFLPPDSPDSSLNSVAILTLLAAAIAGFFVIIGRYGRGDWIVAAILSGISAAGLIGLGLLTHPGGSQHYFWQSIQPVFAIAMAWTLILLWRKYGTRFGVAALLVLLLSHAAWATTQRIWLVSCVVVLASTASAAILHRMSPSEGVGERGVWWRIAAIVVLSAVLSGTAQIVSVPTGRAGGAASDEASERAIHETQLAAYRYIRTHSSPEEVIVTNKHCMEGSLATNDCVPRWFSLAAWSERRVLVEGWAYTHRGESLEPVSTELELSADFVNAPTAAKREALLEKGVTLVYIDKREPYSRELAKVATLAFESEWANVYSFQGQ